MFLTLASPAVFAFHVTRRAYLVMLVPCHPAFCVSCCGLPRYSLSRACEPVASVQYFVMCSVCFLAATCVPLFHLWKTVQHAHFGCSTTHVLCVPAPINFFETMQSWECLGSNSISFFASRKVHTKCRNSTRFTMCTYVCMCMYVCAEVCGRVQFGSFVAGLTGMRLKELGSASSRLCWFVE